MLSQFTPISAIETFKPTNIFESFPGICIGADIDDDWLSKASYARISTPGDYSFDTAKQVLAAITPAYNPATKIWDMFAVQSLTSQQVLITAITAKIILLAATYSAHVNAGFRYGGRIYQIDTASAQRMLTVKVQIKGGIPGLGYWVGSDNLKHTMEDATALTFFDAAYVYGQACNDVFFTKRQALMAAQSQQDIDAIDITADWPQN